MTLETLERIKRLRARAKAFAGFFDNEAAKQKANRSLDKYGAGFNLDGRFSAFKVAVSFDSWNGYYGNSSCSCVGPQIDHEDAKKYLVAALNVHKRVIFQTMAELMEKDAESMIEPAKKELEQFTEMMNALLERPGESEAAA